MSILFRGSSRALFRQTSRLSSRSGHPLRLRAFASSTSAPAECTLLASELANGSSSPATEQLDTLAKLQLSPAVLAQLQTHMQSDGGLEQDAFYVVDTSAVEDRFKLWHEHLPEVRPYYAVKCNPDAVLLESLARLGAGFDCASRAEISAVLNTGVPAEDIIFANPCKQGSHISYAESVGVEAMTFDSEDELTKIKSIHPNAKLVLRLYVDDSSSICRLGTKFGAMVHDVPDILSHAKALEMNIVGVSFHVGSGCFDVRAYSEAVARARKVFDIGASLGFELNLLDIGGGFPGTESAPIRFEDCARELKTALATHFPQDSGVRIISEPGRFFAASTHTLAVNVIGRKVAPTFDEPGKAPVLASASAAAGKVPNYMYFVNDGLYGSFNCMVYDHPTIQPVVLSDGTADKKDTPMHTASLWGPTCDGMDCIMKEVRMPVMEIGQWICFPGMGAYTCAAGSDFNGFAPPQKIYFDSKFVADEAQFVH